MEVPCVRIPREEGERTRKRLADAEVIDRRFRIETEGDAVFIPVTAPEVLDAEDDVVTRTPERRDDRTLPRELLDDPPSYERLGTIALVDEDDPERATAVATALMDASLPITAVLNRASKIKGEERVREWEVLAGTDTETVHREFGAEFHIDVTEVYFSPRLATERNRVVSQIGDGERVFDMFAGVGPFVIPAAMRGATGVGVDINPSAIDYLEENAERNGVADRVRAVRGDVRGVSDEYAGWADRIVMNLPHRADAFLEAARTIASDACRVHYYDIQPEADPFTPGEAAIRAAFDPGYDVAVRNQHIVRSYAPHEVNVCLDVAVHRSS